MAKTGTANISIRMDADLKAAAEELFEELGMNLSTAFNIFVRQSLREGRIPFAISRGTPTEETVAAMRGQGTVSRIVNNHFMQVIMEIRNSDGEIQGIIIALSSLSLRGAIMSYLRSQRVTTIGLCALIAFLCCGLVYFFLKRNFKKVQNELDMINAGHQEAALTQQGFKEFCQMSASFDQLIDRYREMERSRQEFVSNVSHELKTPITSMKILADSLLLQENVPVEYYQEFMQDITQEIDRENKIITDLLSMVRLDKKAANLNMETVDITWMLEGIIKRLKPIAQARGIELILEVTQGVQAEVDEGKLGLAFSNLIENGIKYNVDGGWVRVTLNADKKYFYVTVADCGMGIPEDQQEHIFERFYRGDKSHSTTIEGTGLGLAITKSAILLHHGVIRLNSKVGEGTTFNVRIPISRQ